MDAQTHTVNPKLPNVVMGTMYIGDMQLRYDLSGCSFLRYSSGLQAMFFPDPHDASLYVQAEGLGYGRQVGLLVRDRVLMHCLLGLCKGAEPSYMLTTAWAWENRVDALLCHLHSVKAHQQPWGIEDETVLAMARSLLYGWGLNA